MNAAHGLRRFARLFVGATLIGCGKLYIFCGAGSKAAHALDLTGNTALAVASRP